MVAWRLAMTVQSTRGQSSGRSRLVNIRRGLAANHNHGQAAYFTELFPASIRYSGVSITYAIGAIRGGAFAPLISAWLIQQTGTAWAVVTAAAPMIDVRGT